MTSRKIKWLFDMGTAHNRIQGPIATRRPSAVNVQARRGKPTGWFADRVKSASFLLLYSAMFYLAYRDYVSIEWGYTGLRFSSLKAYEAVLIALAIALQGWMMPQKITSPSAVILWMLTAMIYVPTMIITIMIGERVSDSYYGSLAALSGVMLLASIVCKDEPLSLTKLPPPPRFFITFSAVFGIITIVLYYQYGEIMSFSSIEDVYFQRFAAAEMGGGGLIGYLRTHYLYVFSSTLMAASFIDKKYWFLMPIGLLGYLITYLIDASKIAFIIPLLMVSFFWVHNFASAKAWVLNAGMAFLTFFCGLIATYSSGTKLIADLVLFRSIAIPAQTFAQYADVFSSRGFTWWSNVRGVNLLLDPPDSFASDPYWPILGQIVGAEYHGFDSRSNLNANLFAGEGIAAAGSFGVFAVGLAMIVWLRLFDAVAKDWNQRFAILITVPLGMSITNTHLTTFLMSFGGFFWIALMHFYKPDKTRPGLR
jgi:hypothetical protein